MPVRWVLCPTVQDTDGVFKPKVATLIDLGKSDVVVMDPEDGEVAFTRGYDHSSVVQVGGQSLCFVRFLNSTNMDLDPQCISVFERDHEDAERFLERTPRQEAWLSTKTARLRGILAQHEADDSDLTADSPFWMWLERLGKRFGQNFQPRGTWVAG